MVKNSRSDVPPFRCHKGTGQGYVLLDGRRMYLGKYDLPETRRKYDQTISEWLTNGRHIPVQNSNQTVADLCDAYSTWARRHYRRPDGSSTFKKWEVVQDSNGRWLIPVRNLKGTVVDLRVYRIGKKAISTKGCKVGLFGSEQLSDQKRKSENVYVCEGEFDAMALDWLLRKIGQKGICVAVPGAGTFKKEWAPWLAGRRVVLCYDNDEPGRRGSKKA